MTKEYILNPRGYDDDEPDEPPRIPLVFIAGPFRATREYVKENQRDRYTIVASDHWQIHENVEAARKVAAKVCQLGALAVCPHTMTGACFQDLPGCSDEFWLAGILRLLEKCDAVVMMDGWRESEGAVAEREATFRLGLPRFYAQQGVDCGTPQSYFREWIAEFKAPIVTCAPRDGWGDKPENVVVVDEGRNCQNCKYRTRERQLGIHGWPCNSCALMERTTDVKWEPRADEDGKEQKPKPGITRPYAGDGWW